jgi:tRNA A37 threonylcarbamoyladenosine synthetase subunit TsaC/SUA5/YrdC
LETLDKYIKKYDKLTLILKLKNASKYKGFNWTLWVRLLNHDFQKFVEKLDHPFITTSANISWKTNIREISELDSEIIKNVDYIIEWKKVFGKGSTIVNLVNNTIIER